MEEQQPQDQPHKDTSPAQPVDASPESAQQSSQTNQDPNPVGQTQTEGTQGTDVPQEAPASEEDLAPDANEPGDDELDPELQQHVQDQPDNPDEVDQEG